MDINQRIEIADENLTNAEFMPNPTVIKVVGVGNGGCNAVNRMIEEGLAGVSFIAMNTDAQQLSRSKANVKVVLGREITGGLGAGTDPEKGAEAARRDEKKIAAMLEGADLVFVASGFGGGTGTGASPIIASIAKASGALTIGVVTKPFEMEGQLKMTRAEKGIEQMSSGVDSLIVIPNENLNGMFEEDITFEDSFKVVDDILRQAVQGISDIITETGFGLNVDFADVQTMIRNSDGRAHLGIGYGKGETRIDRAVSNAFNNPLLDVENIRNASGILANIVCPKDFSLREHKEAMKIISHYAAENANIKVGICQKDDMLDEIRATIIATGFEHGKIMSTSSDNKDSDSNSKIEPISTDKLFSGNKPSGMDSSEGESMATRSLNSTKQLLEKAKIAEQTEPVVAPKPVEQVEVAPKPIEPVVAPKPVEQVEVAPKPVEPVVAPKPVEQVAVAPKPVEPVVAPSAVEQVEVAPKPVEPVVAPSAVEPQAIVAVAPEIKVAPAIQPTQPVRPTNIVNAVREEPIQNINTYNIYMDKKQDEDIQEAINIANSIKNSSANKNYDAENNASHNSAAQNENRAATLNANNTQNSKANSDHIVEQNNRNMHAASVEPPVINRTQYNTNSTYKASVPEKDESFADPELSYEKDSEYVYESAKTISPHSGQRYVEDPHYGMGELAEQEEQDHHIYDDTDIDTPAFLRRIIQTKK